MPDLTEAYLSRIRFQRESRLCNTTFEKLAFLEGQILQRIMAEKCFIQSACRPQKH
jgi:hypothetical protein